MAVIGKGAPNFGKVALNAGDIIVSNTPYNDARLNLDTGDLVTGDVENLPDGGFYLWVVHTNLQGTVTVNYDGKDIVLMPGENFTLGKKESNPQQTEYRLKAITITVSGGATANYLHTSP